MSEETDLLPEKERMVIREEEIYRDEVRAQLAREKRPRTLLGRTSKFLNSPFGLWLLSTVVLGTLTWCYAAFQQHRDQLVRNDEARRKLGLEIVLRVREFGDLMQRSDQVVSQIATGQKSPDDVDQNMSQIRRALKPTDGMSGMPEFRDRALPSLVWELMSLVSDDNRDKLDEAFSTTAELYEDASNFSLIRTNDPPIVNYATRMENGLAQWQGLLG